MKIYQPRGALSSPKSHSPRFFRENASFGLARRRPCGILAAGEELRMAAAGKRVAFTGRVQGVGFRYSARSLARDFRVTGYVRNMPDGSVELVAQGEPHEIESFLAALKARMSGYIRDARERDEPATGRFESFEIAF
jgi:acylphosphatase